MEDDLSNQQSQERKGGFFKIPPNQKYDESSSNALTGLFFYSVLMFTIPLLVLFLSPQFLTEYFQLESPYSQLVPAILAVVAVNIIIVAYVMKAFRENAKEAPNGDLLNRLYVIKKTTSGGDGSKIAYGRPLIS